jgi:hypothetical protein
MSEPTMEGLAASRARGRTAGPKLAGEPAVALLVDLVAHRPRVLGPQWLELDQIAAEFGVRPPTIYHYLDEMPRVQEGCPVEGSFAERDQGRDWIDPSASRSRSLTGTTNRQPLPSHVRRSDEFSGW